MPCWPRPLTGWANHPAVGPVPPDGRLRPGALAYEHDE